ncbi:hypothetical protein DFH11DRAFT_1514246 [Phellopilus nigrolimitatus]|nr:hypothetical protein DFH11DRAFT_1514246 [Phellopilus nigrolimitatus]
MIHTVMPFDVSVVPNDIWYEIASFLEVKDIISLEDTCIFIREIFSDRIFWLKHLHALDQDHAPDLPRHIPLTDLTWSDLRNLVVRAQRQSLNCTGPTPLRATRETTVPVGSANSDGVLGRLYGSGTDVALLPGGSLLLVCWSAGYLQCWDVPGRECLWTHMPEASLGEPDTQPLRVCSFGYDMQANGEVRVLVVSESADNDPSLK